MMVIKSIYGDVELTCDVLFLQDCPNGEDEAYCGQCTFEDYNTPYCQWANVNTDTFMWSIGAGSTLTPNTGPDNDHTLGNGKGTCKRCGFDLHCSPSTGIYATGVLRSA